MFVLAGASFAFGGWQYLQARNVQSASQQRMAFMMTAIQKSGIATAQKKELYASIMRGLPPAPGIFSLDLSNSFASTTVGDSCTSDGQRAICASLKLYGDAATRTAVCGACDPK